MIDYNKIFEVNDSYQAPAKVMEILRNEEEREKLFMKLLEVNDYNVGFDWFHVYFEEEHTERRKKKQYFTPKCVADLASKILLTDTEINNGNYYEPAAGTGGMMIKHWDNFRRTFSPFDYKPEYHFAMVEELSDRAIPFLLLNMMIRGMNGVVVHGDTLTRKCKNAYFIRNKNNDHLQFSELIDIPHNEVFAKELMVEWIE